MRGEKDSAPLMVHVTDRVDNEPAATYDEPGGGSSRMRTGGEWTIAHAILIICHPVRGAAGLPGRVYRYGQAGTGDPHIPHQESLTPLSP